MSLTADDSVSTHQIASASAPAPSPDSASLPLYPSLSTPSSFSLTEFFSRPVCLYTYAGSGSITTLPTETYASDYIGLTSVQEKLKYLKLLRGTFKVDFLLTTSPYAFGQFICAFYMGSPASTGCSTLDPTLFNYWLSSKDKVILDCANMTSGSISIPMHIVYPFTDVAIVSSSSPDPVLAEMRMSITTLVPILNALDGTSSPFTIKVFVSLLNPEVTVPVFQDVGTIYTSETQRAMDGPISYPASIVARIGKSLSKVPVIGKFAYATSLAAEAVSSIAILFGFSRPKDMSIVAYPHQEDYASYAGNLRIKGLTLDPLAEIPIDNSFLGDMGDNLTYQNTIQREGLLAIFAWNKAQPAAYLVYQCAVAPYLSTGVLGVMSLPPVSYVSQLFNLWRGTLRFRFVVPANRYLRGKLRFYWSPTYVSAMPSPDVYQQITQNSTSVILDLAQSTEITMEFPYAVRSPFSPVISAWSDQESGTVSTEANGYLYCIVEEPLLCQSTALGLSVLVWLSAGDDFQFAIPSTHRMPYLRRQIFNTLYSSGQTLVDPGTVSVLPNPPVEQQTLENYTDIQYYRYTSEVVSNSMNPGVSKTVVMTPPTMSSDVMQLHIGEEFGSLRNLLKRFFPNYLLSTGGNPNCYGFFLPYLPLEPFFYLSGGEPYHPNGMNTPLRYISSMFYGVRGSVRYRLNHPLQMNDESEPASVSVFRDFQQLLCQVLSNPTPAFSWMWLKTAAGSGEQSFLIRNGEPIFFEIPYQCNQQYQRTTVILPPYNAISPQYGVTVNYQSFPNSQVEVYVAAGEDFMPVIWNGVPLVAAFAPGSETS
jgi:hypothetical protein